MSERNEMNTINLRHTLSWAVDIDDNEHDVIEITGRRTPTGPLQHVILLLGPTEEAKKQAAKIIDTLMDAQLVEDPFRNEALTSEVKVLLETMERWHNNTHDGAFRTCMREPCVEVVRADAEERRTMADHHMFALL